MDAIAIMREADYKADHSEITLGEYEEMIRPLVDVEPVVHAHWIWDGNARHYSCSACGGIAGAKGYDYSAKTKYCGDCGALMDGEEKTSEYKQEATQMTQYDKIMQEMTPRDYAERLFTDHLKCYYCAYRGRINCHPAKPMNCIDGITEWLNRKVTENE